MIKVLYIDSETGGVKPGINPLLNLACIIEIDGEVKDERLFQIRPYADQHIEKEALDINGLLMSDILNYSLPDKAHEDLTKWLGQYCDKYDHADKFFVGGYKIEHSNLGIKRREDGIHRNQLRKTKQPWPIRT